MLPPSSFLNQQPVLMSLNYPTPWNRNGNFGRGHRAVGLLWEDTHRICSPELSGPWEISGPHTPLSASAVPRTRHPAKPTGWSRHHWRTARPLVSEKASASFCVFFLLSVILFLFMLYLISVAFIHLINFGGCYGLKLWELCFQTSTCHTIATQKIFICWIHWMNVYEWVLAH